MIFTLALALAAAVTSGASNVSSGAAMSATDMATTSASQMMAPGLHYYGGLTLAPNGKTMVTLETALGAPAGGFPRGVLTFRDTTGKVTSTSDPCPTCRYSDLAWSPDSQSLAFLSADAKTGDTALYVVTNGTSRVVTTIKGTAGRPRWSPDGKTIALLAVPGAHKLTGATQAGAAQVGEIGVDTNTDEQRIATIPVAGGDLNLVSPSDTWVYEYDWTPDGKGFVATAAKGDGDNNWWTAKLEAFGTDGSERVIAAPKTQLNFPRASADGKSVLYIGGLMSDFGSVGGDVYSVPFAGGEPVNVTPDYKATFTTLNVTKGGVFATFIQGGETGIAKIEAAKSAVTVLSHGEYSQGSVGFDAAGKTVAMTVEGPAFASRIEAGAPGAAKPITHDNDAAQPAYTMKSVTWTNEGFTVQGWLAGPAAPEAGKTYPMITIVHGGPSAAYSGRFPTGGSSAEMIKAGYYVFMPNPRGSYGQGEAFVQSNKRDFGGGDLRDILAGIDAVEKVAPVDDARLGVMGHSYGGLMTMWTVTHSNRFKAAVAGAGIANWSSYYGQNGIDQWMIPFFGASFYDDPAIYDKLSPIRYIKDAKTPTFIYVGERDVECPAAQSLEFWHGLKAMNVPVSLVIYEGEGHGIRDPKHTKDMATRTMAWFDKYLK